MAGRSIYPTDIERAASRVEGVRPGCAVAVRLDAGLSRESFSVAVESNAYQDTAEVRRIKTRGRARSGHRRRHAPAQRRRARARGDPEDAVGQAASRAFVGPSGLIHRVEQVVSRPHVASRNAAARCIGNARVHRRRLRRTTTADRCPASSASATTSVDFPRGVPTEVPTEGNRPPADGLPPPAEPQSAPPQTAPVPGRIVPVGKAPEGVVVDAATRTVAVAKRDPNELVLLNADTGQVVQRVPLPGFVRHLQLADPGGPVLVPVESANALVRVELPNGRALPQIVTGHRAPRRRAGRERHSVRRQRTRRHRFGAARRWKS